MADPGCGYTVQTDVQLWMRDRLVEASTSCPLAMPIPCAVRLRPRRTKPLNKDSVTVSAHPLTEAAQSFIV